jgi:hypothetical protein
LGVPHVELDALHWGPNWTEADTNTFRADVHRALTGDRWVVDGNYAAVREIVWSRADTIVWLDYSVGTVLSRLLVRTVRRSLGLETLWNGNRERFWVQFATRDSIIIWMFKTHWNRRKTYRALLAAPEHMHLRSLRFSSPRQAGEWLEALRSAELPAVRHSADHVLRVRADPEEEP